MKELIQKYKKCGVQCAKCEVVWMLTVILYACVFTSNLYANAYNWGALGSGTNGTVYAVTYWNGKIIVGGSFTQAGGVGVYNIAYYDGSWHAIGGLGNIGNAVYSLAVFNGDLYAGGSFPLTGGGSIARWNANFNTWDPVSGGTDGIVRALKVFNSRLYVGGTFTNAGFVPAHNIASWSGSVWQPLGTTNNEGTNSTVYALEISGSSVIYAGGSFTAVANGMPAFRIAGWNIASWVTLGAGMNDTVRALTIHNGQLVAGGKFTIAGGNPANRIANWNGYSWSPIGSGTDDIILSLASYNSELIAGGIFRYAGGNYVDRVAKWNGTVWSRMVTGTNSNVNTLFVQDTTLYTGGSFTTAGGKYISRIATWRNEPTSTVSGIVRYLDNGQPVPINSKVRAQRLDLNTWEIIQIDSALTDANGNYILYNVWRDSNLYIIGYPPDEFNPTGFVPTYYQSSVDWQTAVRLYPINNLSNININVYRIVPGPQNILAADISGYVYLTYTPMRSPLDIGLPYKSGAIVYVRQNNVYKEFGVSNTLEHYLIPQLAPGVYDLYVNRIGYTSAQRTVTLGTINLDTVNFYLDTVNPIGIHNVGTKMPKNFALYQNYPNPFNSSSKFKFQSSKLSNVKITIYDILGKEIEILVNQILKPGTYEIEFNAVNLPSGVYFYKMTAAGFSDTKKMILIR